MNKPPTLVPTDAWDMAAEATSPMQHRCPFKNELDVGTITIGWRVDHQTVELHSLRDYLAGYADLTVSHEDLTREVYDDLAELGLLELAVTTRWETAGMAVVVTA